MKAFELIHGPIDKWSVATWQAYAGTDGQSVTYNFKVDGKNLPDGMLSMKLVLLSGQWRVDGLAFQL